MCIGVIEHYNETHLYDRIRFRLAMCDFISKDLREKNKLKNRNLEEQNWEIEPELESVQEEDQPQAISVTQ
ncbi:MAG TPA: hypothetical protein VJ729_07945 [Nitrososphaeraceae archaeon]|nr:hypothetical protein [Nitrososphaeraceae archaeon]